ncbi:hypothetical protein ACM66B_003353 [Microbotryomycetes sp. NB124-2]
MHSHSVVHSDLSTIIPGTSQPLLSTLSLTLRFQSLGSTTKSSQTFDETTLENALLDPTTLMFSIHTLVLDALVKVADKLVQAFPVCFNAAFIQRLNKDLVYQTSLAASLVRLSSRMDKGSGRATESRRLLEQLDKAVSPARHDYEDRTELNHVESVSTALLVLARNHGCRDALPKSNKTARRGRAAGHESDLELELDQEKQQEEFQGLEDRKMLDFAGEEDDDDLMLVEDE